MSDSDLEDLAFLAELEKEEKRRERYSEWCPHTPHPKQQRFIALDCIEALYGGAAAGGKSDALLMAALQYVHVPGYAALILRRTFKDLNRSEAIMARAEEWLRPTRAKWKHETKSWTFPSGATLTFGYFDTERDKDAYQGGAWQFIAFDELTQFPEGWYSYLFSRLRKTEQHGNIPLRMRAASNPGGIGHEWVFRRFVDEATACAPFVPARLDDNPSVPAESYRESLKRLDETTRRQLEEGIWLRDASGLVYRKPETIAQKPLPDAQWRYLLGVDFGIKDATAYVVLGWLPNDRTVWVVESFKETGTTVTQSAERILKYQEQYAFSTVVGDLGGMGKAFGEEMQRRYSIPIEAAQKQNKRGYIGLLNGVIERKELIIVQPTNTALIKELAELPWKDESHQHEADGFDNHLTDALLYAWRASTAFSQQALVTKPTDPLEVIRQETAAVWAQYEADLNRKKSEDQANSYDDVGSPFDHGDF